MPLFFHPDDRKLATTIKALVKGVAIGPKRDRLERDFLRIRDRIAAEDLQRCLDLLWKHLLPMPDKRAALDPKEALGFARSFRDGGFIGVAQVLFSACLKEFAELPIPVILENAPTAESLEAWRKIAKTPKADLEREILLSADGGAASCGGDWLLGNSRPEKLTPLLTALLARLERPKYLPTWEESVSRYLAGDRKGSRLKGILLRCGNEPDLLKGLCDAIGATTAALQTVADDLPPLLVSRDAGPPALALVERLMETAAATTSDSRLPFSVCAARLGTGILLLSRPGPSCVSAIQALESATRRLRLADTDAATRSNTWVLENLGQTAQARDHAVQLSDMGVRHLAGALEKARQGFHATDVLSVLAENLGLSPIGRVGDTVPYDPLCHEDLDGGLVSGDEATVVTGGWTCQQTVVLRAQVCRRSLKTSQDRSHQNQPLE